MVWVSYSANVSGVFLGTGISAFLHSLFKFKRVNIPVAKHMLMWSIVYAVN